MNRAAPAGTYRRLTILLIGAVLVLSLATKQATGADDTPTATTPGTLPATEAATAATSATRAATPSATIVRTHAATVQATSPATASSTPTITPTALPTVVGGLMPILTVRYSAPITSVAFLPDGSRILTGSEDGSLSQWDIANGTQIGNVSVH